MIILAAALLAGSTFAAGVQDAPPPAPPPTQTHVRRGPPPPESVTGDHASLPMTFTDGLPTIAVTINGKGPFRIGFDTGAPGGPRLTDRVAAALELSQIGEARASDPSGNNPVTVKLYRVDRLDFGPVAIAGWVGTAAPARPGKLESLDGIVGLSAFAGYVVTIDYAAGQIRFDRGALPVPDGKQVFAYSGSIPSVPLSIEGRTIDAHLDTGNIRFGIIVPEAFAAQLAHKGEAHSIGQAHTVSNTIDMFAMPVDGGAHVGAIGVPATEIGYPSVIDSGNIGSLALRSMVVRVDPANQRIEIVPGRS